MEKLILLKKIEYCNKFLEQKFKILVSTTIIEVGIDFPNANIILIEMQINLVYLNYIN